MRLGQLYSREGINDTIYKMTNLEIPVLRNQTMVIMWGELQNSSLPYPKERLFLVNWSNYYKSYHLFLTQVYIFRFVFTVYVSPFQY